MIITGSSGWERVGRLLHIGKLPLISALQAHIHAGVLKVARGLPEAEILANELANFRVVQTATDLFSIRRGAAPMTTWCWR